MSRILYKPAHVTMLGITLCAIVAATARAQTYPSTRSSSSVTTNATGFFGIGLTSTAQYSYNGSPNPNNAVFAPSATLATASATMLQGAYGTAYSSAAPGALRVYAQAAYPYDMKNQYVESYSNSSFYDVLTVGGYDTNGNLLPFGTPVQLKFTSHVTGTISPTPLVISNNFYNSGYFRYDWDIFAGTLTQLPYRYGDGYLNQPSGLTAKVRDAFVGQQIFSSESATAVAKVNGFLPGVPSIEVAFQNTVRTFVDGTGSTPGAFVTSASGHDYRSLAVVVPEAGTLSLLMLAASSFSVGILRRRRMGCEK